MRHGVWWPVSDQRRREPLPLARLAAPRLTAELIWAESIQSKQATFPTGRAPPALARPHPMLPADLIGRSSLNRTACDRRRLLRRTGALPRAAWTCSANESRNGARLPKLAPPARGLAETSHAWRRPARGCPTANQDRSRRVPSVIAGAGPITAVAVGRQPCEEDRADATRRGGATSARQQRVGHGLPAFARGARDKRPLQSSRPTNRWTHKDRARWPLRHVCDHSSVHTRGHSELRAGR